MVAINLGKVRADTGIGSTPVGTILPWSKATAPAGFLKCDGTAISRTTFADLFSVIGTTYGSGDGSTTFNLPDLTTRNPVGANSSTNVGQTAGPANLDGVVDSNVTQNLGTSVTGEGFAACALSLAQTATHRHNLRHYGGSGPFGNAPGIRQNYNPSRSGCTGEIVQPSGDSGAHTHQMNASSFVINGTVSGQNISVYQPHLIVIYIIKF